MTVSESEEGFALVESICALFVGTLIMVALALTVGIVLRFSTAVARQTNEAEILTSGLAALRRDLSGALAIPADAKPNGTVLFHGSPGSIGFATSSEIVWIEAAARKGTGALMRSARPAPPAIRSLGTPDHRDVAPLLSGPWTFRFSFAGSDEREGTWTGEWIGRDRLPDLVKLDVFDTDETGRPVISVALSPHMRMTRHCSFDDPPSCLSPLAEAGAP